ncbi:MAG: sulfotransferase family protein, partial [Gammaproteobacteria bacterium]
MAGKRKQAPPPRRAAAAVPPAAADPALAAGSAAEQAGDIAGALFAYRQLLAEQPRHAQANLRVATLLSEQAKDAEAISHWRHALAQLRSDPYAHAAYALSLFRTGRLHAAAEQYRRALKLAGGRAGRKAEQAQLWYQLSLVYQELQADEEQESALRKALKLDPANVRARAALGYLLGLKGDREGALAAYRRAIQIDPEFGAAHRFLAAAKRHEAEDDEVRMMRDLFERGRGSPEDRANLAFGLGKACEDLGRHAEAFDYWRKANALIREQHPYNVGDDIVVMQRLQRAFTKDYIQREASPQATGITPVFIVSMPRAGSSLTEQILAAHSAVYGGGELRDLFLVCQEAVPDFPQGLAKLRSEDWAGLAGQYLQRVARRMQGEAFITDKLPGNFQLIGAIRMMFPNARVVHVKRDPMDVALSCFKTPFSPGTVMQSNDLTDLGIWYRHYEKMMRYWRRILPGWIHELEYEQLTA